jgi:hypothetical protein
MAKVDPAEMQKLERAVVWLSSILTEVATSLGVENRKEALEEIWRLTDLRARTDELELRLKMALAEVERLSPPQRGVLVPSDKLKAMQERIEELEERLARPWAKNPGVTHSEGCWKWHLDCALLKIENLEQGLQTTLLQLADALKEIRRIKKLEEK